MRNTVVAGLALAVLLAGCQGGQTEGQKMVQDLTKAINGFADSLRKGKAEIETTLAEYDQVINNTDGDLLGHFKKFNSGLDSIEKRAEAVRKQSDEVEKAADPFFAQWQADLEKFSSEDMKKRSKERMEETKKRFQEIDKIGDKAKAAYDPLMATLRDHALYLSNDLYKAAAETLKKDAAKIEKAATTLYGLIDQILGAADNYNKAVAMRTNPPPAAEGCGEGEAKSGEGKS
jgi:DNA repair ATPase RecN